MPSSGSCFRCSKRPILVSSSGLCRECAATDDTAAPTSRAPDSRSEAPTGSFCTSDAFASTAAGSPSGAARPLPQAPPGYDLLDRLGGGGMGEVFLAREQPAERLVAMKFIRHPGDPNTFERFVIELRVLAKLDHPNIVRVFASDFLRADPFFTMEYLPGGSLSRSLGGDPLPVAEAVALVRTVAEAVAVAHAANVIHRDLKPSNILLAADGTPKVADFGLAKRLDEVDPLTLASGGLGTPGYMPPEQISRKNGEIGPWSDVYGLGATLYHLLTGRAPFDGDTPLDTIAHVLSDPPSRPHALRSEIPLALEAVVLKCLEKDPKDRYPTAAEFVADLDRFTAGQKPVAPPLTPWRRAKRWTRRNRLKLATAVAVVALAIGLVSAGRAFAPVPPLPSPGPVVAPFDPVAEKAKRLDAIRADLLAGKSVTLIGEKGEPLWYECPTGPVTFADARGGGCHFQAFKLTAVVLLEPPLDRYRVELDIRHTEAELQWVAPTVGFFVNYNSLASPDGVGHAYLAVNYTDRTSPKLAAVVEVESALYFGLPDRSPGRHSWPIATKAIAEAKETLPGPWRRITADISPERVVFSWRLPGGPDQVLADLTAEALGRYRERHAAQLVRTARITGRPLPQPPDWSPRRGFGVCATQSGVTVRNVVVSPVSP